MANRAEFPAGGAAPPPFLGFWTSAEVELVTGLKEEGVAAVLWGIDRRGVSTLGNFIAEMAGARGLSSFHVAAFAAGGRIRAGLAAVDADETRDDPAFALLASLARHPATVFDLRSVRPALHFIPPGERSPVERSLLYWADSYDAIICFREVTPLGMRRSRPAGR